MRILNAIIKGVKAFYLLLLNFYHIFREMYKDVKNWDVDEEIRKQKEMMRD